MTKNEKLLYIYLFEKIGFKVCENYINSYKIYYWLFFNNQLIIATNSPLNEIIDELQKFNINTYPIELQPYIKFLKQFSIKLESKEHVDMLLTLNGLNKEV